MFASTKSKVKQALGMVKIRVDKNSPEAKRIDSIKSQRGGWTKQSLSALGIPWPPPKGWRKNLIRESLKPSFDIQPH